MRGMIIIKTDIKSGKIRHMALLHFGNQLFRRNTHLIRFQHNRRAVRIVSTDKVNFMTAHTLKTHPNIRLNMFKHMS